MLQRHVGEAARAVRRPAHRGPRHRVAIAAIAGVCVVAVGHQPGEPPVFHILGELIQHRQAAGLVEVCEPALCAIRGKPVDSGENGVEPAAPLGPVALQHGGEKVQAACRTARRVAIGGHDRIHHEGEQAGVGARA